MALRRCAGGCAVVPVVGTESVLLMVPPFCGSDGKEGSRGWSCGAVAPYERGVRRWMCAVPVTARRHQVGGVLTQMAVQVSSPGLTYQCGMVEA